MSVVPSAHGARTFLTLDGLRGLAAIAVAVRHAPFMWEFGTPKGLFYESYLAVDFFFVLSGFILSFAYGNRIENGMPFLDFLKVRLIRLYPLYALAFFISLVVAAAKLATGKTSISEFIVNVTLALFLIPFFSNTAPFFPMNGPAWSIFLEIIANSALGKFGGQLRTAHLAIFVSFAALALVFSVNFKLFGFGSLNGPLDAGGDMHSFCAGLIRVSYSFFVGVLVHRVWKRHDLKISVSPIFLFASLAAILLMCPLKGYESAFDIFIALVIFPLMVFLGASSKTQGWTSQIFLTLGALSYAIYILQYPIYSICAFLGGKSLMGLPYGVRYIFAIASLVFVAAIAIVSDKYFDQPVRRALTRRFAQRRQDSSRTQSRCNTQ